jgi:hypothetical protein
MIDQALYAHSEMVFVVTFCMRQYQLKILANNYTWFPNVVVKMMERP